MHACIISGLTLKFRKHIWNRRLEDVPQLGYYKLMEVEI